MPVPTLLIVYIPAQSPRLDAGLDLGHARPKLLTAAQRRAPLVVTVCDRAHEELDVDPAWLHWSVPDPVLSASSGAFDATVSELRSRIDGLVGVS